MKFQFLVTMIFLMLVGACDDPNFSCSSSTVTDTYKKLFTEQFIKETYNNLDISNFEMKLENIVTTSNQLNTLTCTASFIMTAPDPAPAWVKVKSSTTNASYKAQKTDDGHILVTLLK